MVYSYPGALGIKIGYTDRLIVAVLGSQSVYDDADLAVPVSVRERSLGCAGAAVREPGAAPQAAAP